MVVNRSGRKVNVKIRCYWMQQIDAWCVFRGYDGFYNLYVYACELITGT